MRKFAQQLTSRILMPAHNSVTKTSKARVWVLSRAYRLPWLKRFGITGKLASPPRRSCIEHHTSNQVVIS